MLSLTEEECEITRGALLKHWADMPAGQCFAAKRLLERIDSSRVKLGEKVFSFELALGTDATAPVKKRAKERKELRASLGVTRLAKGVGPAAIKAKPYAPTLNEYNGLVGWRKAHVRESIDGVILEAKTRWPAWAMGVTEHQKIGPKGKVQSWRSGGRRRAVVVTRYSSKRPDEIGVDSIGGKMPLDRLVLASVLRDDKDEWLFRVARWEFAPPDAGRVVIDVHEIAR